MERRRSAARQSGRRSRVRQRAGTSRERHRHTRVEGLSSERGRESNVGAAGWPMAARARLSAAEATQVVHTRQSHNSPHAPLIVSWMLVVQMAVKKSAPRCAQKLTGITNRKKTYGDACGGRNAGVGQGARGGAAGRRGTDTARRLRVREKGSAWACVRARLRQGHGGGRRGYSIGSARSFRSQHIQAVAHGMHALGPLRPSYCIRHPPPRAGTDEGEQPSLQIQLVQPRAALSDVLGSPV